MVFQIKKKNNAGRVFSFQSILPPPPPPPLDPSTATDSRSSSMAARCWLLRSNPLTVPSSLRSASTSCVGMCMCVRVCACIHASIGTMAMTTDEANERTVATHLLHPLQLLLLRLCESDDMVQLLLQLLLPLCPRFSRPLVLRRLRMGRGCCHVPISSWESLPVLVLHSLTSARSGAGSLALGRQFLSPGCVDDWMACALECVRGSSWSASINQRETCSF